MGTFREFLGRPVLSNVEIANIYFGNPKTSVQEILDLTGLSKREFYAIVHNFGVPNRLRTNHHNVISLADQGMPLDQIARATKYSTQNVKYILRKNLHD
ncbi:MAG: hypothetical protein M0R80_03210 [Proteobacteria bacterium]|jgi:hypothetical protein|nr:hypothetical protein [Pseudomonadota bacterium]